MAEHPAPRRDRGFTLVEVLIVIVVVGLISAVITNIFSVIVRTTPQAEARADDSRSLLGLSTWLPADLSSTPHTLCSDPPGCSSAASSWDRTPSRSSGCAGADSGVNLLRLSWTESFGTVATTSTYVANYRYANTSGKWRIERSACLLGGPRSVLNLTSDLPPIDPATWTQETFPVWVTFKVDEGFIVGASFRIQTVEGDNVRIDGSSNNVNVTLPPLTPVVTVATTTTVAPTTTTTTTIPETTTTT
ncbi:MAG: prepilin-type N-terminal cleavage/methylation domain-containing protein, partial [Ilumatobacteraceae bacterium]